MLYDFIDVYGMQGESDLPAEAVSYDGKWLDKEIPGFRTLSVSGREIMASVIDEKERENANGSIYKRKRYAARDIKVNYQLIADTAHEFRILYNRLCQILDAEQVQVLFNDEPDKFFIGTKSDIEEVPEGRNSVVASFTIHCTDPLKYSTKLYSASADSSGTINIQYNGTAPYYPEIETIVGSGGTANVTYMNQNGKVIEFGNESSTITKKWEEEYNQSTPINYNSAKKDVLPRSFFLQGEQNLNKETNLPVYDLGGIFNGVNPMAYGKPTANAARHGIYMAEKLSHDTSKTFWNGSSITWTIPNDPKVTDDTSAGYTDWYLWFHSAMVAGSAKQVGYFSISVEDQNHKAIATMTFLKNNQTDKVQVWFHVGDLCATVHDDQYLTCNGNKTLNPWLNDDNGYHSIRKNGATFTFHLFTPEKFQYSLYKDTVAKYITLYVGGLNAKNNDYPLITLNYLKGIMFTGYHEGVKIQKEDTTTVGVANFFTSGSVVTVDTSQATISVNGVTRNGVSYIGNAWESFQLKNGVNRIRAVMSSWCSGSSHTVYYREAFL